MDTLDGLIAGRAEVEKGWVKFHAVTPEGVCAIGGLRKAMGHRHAADSGAYAALLAAVPAHFYGVGMFNDDHRTTKQDILDLYDRAITAEAVKVTADTAHTFATVS